MSRSSLIGMPLAFDDEEYRVRIQRTQEAMQAARLDALLLFHQESMFYLFGYDQLGYWVYQTAIVPLADSEITVVCREADHDLVAGLPAVREVRTWFDDSPDDPVEVTIDALRKLGLVGPGRRIGIELRSHALLPFYYRRLADKIQRSSELVDASDVVTELRLRKSDAELVYVRRAAQILDATYEATFRALRPGVRENEVLGAAMEAMFDAGGEPPAIIPPLASGPRTLASTHGAATNRVLQPDDLFQFEAGTCFQRYHTVGVQSKWLGSAPEGVLRDYEALREALALGVDALKPGRPIAEVAKAVNGRLSESGRHEPGRHIGYGTGLGYPPTWLDNLRVKETDPHVLYPGMVLFMFLHYKSRTDLLFLGEPVVVTEAGSERLSRTPLTLEME